MIDRRLAAVLALALLPWTVTIYPGGSGFVFPWALYYPGAGGAVPITEYYITYTHATTLPPHLTAWGLSALVYGIAAGSALLGAIADREDRRVTGALLLIAALAHLRFSLGTDHAGIITVPVGPVAALVVAWWFHADDLRRLVSPG
ncbi:TIGR04206 family protein [Halostella salina]|uniref:TIGR04206 family protein n=1 Tax=Halostella salina TaxID=1547897 RepID=UPI000EF82CC0|nr:TIGR04206 family protein [Halostella salina]